MCVIKFDECAAHPLKTGREYYLWNKGGVLALKEDLLLTFSLSKFKMIKISAAGNENPIHLGRPCLQFWLILFLFSPFFMSDANAGTGVSVESDRVTSSYAIQVQQISSDNTVRDSVITGTVTSADDESPLVGVTIKVKGTNIGATTNSTGGYNIEAPPTAQTLVFIYVGYQTKEVTINNRSQINVIMEKEVQSLDELVVIGYGSQYRKDLTGSVSSISEEDIERQTVSSPEQLLQGQVSGVQVTKNTGAPGGGSTVRIRGVNSIQAGNDPLYVIDGLPVSGSSSQSESPLALINPQDIVSIEVLKDASATAIYGSRGANGVILVTTNRGQSGNTQVSFEAKYGVNQVRNQLDLLNADQYIALANEAAENSGEEPVFANQPGSYPNTNWQDEVFRSAPQQNYQLSVSGGDESTRYALSANFLNEKGILIGSDFTRGSFRFNFSKDVSDKFIIGNNLIISRAKYDLLETGGRGLSGIINGALQIPAVVPVRDENGNYVFQTENTIERDNPVASALEKTNTSDRFKGVGNLYAEYMIVEGLEARVSIGGDLNYRKQDFYAPRTTLQGRQNNGIGSVQTAQNFRWINENTLTYQKEFLGLHDLTVLAGFTLEREAGESLRGASSGFITDAYEFNNLGAGETPNNPATGSSESALLSYLGRVNYSFDDRYLITLTGRVDGSSRFGEGNKYGFFPSGALAWRISNEDFMKQQNLFSDLKLRLSYGVTGNQEIGNFASLAQLGFSQVTFGNRIAIGINPSSLGNEDLKWERTSQYNAGLDIGLLNNRINLTGDIYYKKTTDLLLTRRVPRFTGFSSYLDNIGSTENRGFELALETQNISREDFSWNTSANFSMNESKVLKLSDGDPLFVGTPISFASGQSFRIIQEGQSLGAFYGYVYGGVYADQAAIDNSPAAPESARPGDPYLEDINGDGKINGNDRRIIGNAFPDFTFGFTNTFFYKGFDLNIFIQGSYGNEILNMNTLRLESVRGFTNQTTDVLNRWTPENTDTNIPRATRSRNSASQTAMRAISTRLIENGSYIRLKNLTLGYTFPVEWVEGIGARTLRLYASALNLVTLTNYDGYDPEVSTYNNLGNIGADYGTYPKAKTYLMGIKLGF